MTRQNYVIELKTDLDLGSRSFVEGTLRGLMDFPNPSLRAEFYGSGEPVRHALSAETLDKAIGTWLSQGRGLMLRRKSKPRYLMDFDWWTRTEKSLDSRPFPWGCTVWLNASAKQEQAVQLFRFLIEQIRPAFGSITSEQDSKAKHFFQTKTATEIIERFRGLDIGDTLPGVYWMTYFGPWAIEKVGDRSRYHDLDSTEEFTDGILLRSFADFEQCGTPEALSREAMIRQKLGVQHFFDRAMASL